MLESPWISVLTLSNPDSQVTKRSKHRKTFKDKVTHVVEELKKTNSSLFFALNGVLDTEMWGGGGVLFPPRPSPRSATESWMWWVDFVCLFFPWYSAIETPSAPTKAAAPVAATRQDVYAGKWEPKITNSRNYQISFVHSVFIKLAASLLYELFLQCYDEDFKRMFYRKSVTFRKFSEIQWEIFIKLP